MTRPATFRRIRTCLVLALATACQKNVTQPGTAAPSGDGAASLEPPTLESLQAELDARNGELSQAATAQPPTPADAGEQGLTRCERVCEIRAAICSLSDSICGLADEHPAEARYATACETAKSDCAHASEVCDGCAE